MTVLAYFSNSQCQTTDDDGTTAKMRMLSIHAMNKKSVVTVPAYLNYFRCLTTEDAGSIATHHVLRNIKDPETVVLTYELEKKMEMTQET